MKLDFVIQTEENQIVSGWSVKPSGDWCKDCDTGAGYAVDLIEHLAASGDMPLFGRVIRDCATDQSGIATGFLAQIGQFAANAA